MTNNSKSQKSDSCYHCGDFCANDSIHKGEKIFCCQGCKTVFEILSENNLVEYYELQKNPGIKSEENVFSDYSFLDIREIKEQLLTFSGGGIEKVTISVPGMHCSSCIWLLENLQQLNPDIVRSEVNFLKKEVSLQYRSGKFSLRKAAELLDSLGYKALIELREKDRIKANKNKDRDYIYKLGISGFAFGNIMLLSFPEYFSGGMYEDIDFGPFFGYFNLVLALPVFFYCSSSFFKSAWKGLRSRFLNIDVPISLGILVFFLKSTYDVLTETGPGYFDSLTGLVFFMLAGRWFQNRSYQALSFERDYRNYFPLAVARIKNGLLHHVQLKDLIIGDEVVIHNGEIIPADSVLVDGQAHIDYSFVTGESLPIQVKAGEKMYAGGRQRGEQIQVKIEKEFSQSYLMQLWKGENRLREDRQDMTFVIDRISHYFTAIVLLVALSSAIYWWKQNPSLIFHAFGSVLIIACPCALALTIPFTFGNGVRIFEKAGFYLRDARMIEIMASTDTIVFDKTGTITTQQNKSVVYHGQPLSPGELVALKSLAKHSTHPLSRTIYNHLVDVREKKIRGFEEHEGKGLKGKYLETEIIMGSAIFTGAESMYDGTAVYIKINDRHMGYFSVGNEYRDGLEELAKRLKPKYELQVITGDGDNEKHNLSGKFGKNTKLYFNMDPFEKRRHIKKLKNEHHKVMMIGDGLNDSGAIKESDIGISISDDIFGFLPSCDAILEAQSFKLLPDFLIFSVKMKKLAMTGFSISFLYNIIGLSFAVQGILSPVIAAIIMPLSSVTVVSFAILSTNLAGKSFNKSLPGKNDKNHVSR